MAGINFTNQPWADYRWSGFDEAQNDIIIGRHLLPSTAGVFSSDIVYDFEAPVGVKSDSKKRGSSYKIYVKWNEFCPCFSSPATDVSPEFVKRIWDHLATKGFTGPASLPNSGEIVYLDDVFVDQWRREFFDHNPQLKMWKSNRIRRDQVDLPKCACPPSVPGHTIIPPFRAPEGWAVNPEGAQLQWEPFFWMDPFP